MPENQAPAAPVIVIKKKKGHGGHHGGAWKVAYADFVTAMMALFIVLWLLSSSEKVQKAVGGYFQDPTGEGKLTGNTMAGAGQGIDLSKDNMDQLKAKLEQAMKEVPKFQQMKDQVHITVTGEGLRIELLETDQGMFFESGNARPSEQCMGLLATLAKELTKLPNQITIEGHTDARPFSGARVYTNWELSADRANAARRVMEDAGLRADQVVQVRGFADRNLRKKDQPDHASNRRISVIVQYRTPPAEKKSGEGSARAAEAPPGAEHKGR